jgi:crossover junction endodeoxyribonuclease RuvC
MISRKPPDYRAALPAWHTPLSDSSPSPSRRNPSGDALANCRRSIRIIGIDPGLRRTGWGVIDTDGVRLVYVACGVILSDDAAQLGLRLRQLFDGLSEVLVRLSPAEAAIEQTFVNRDASATLKLGQARGIALLVPALLGLPIAEYAPNAVKKTVVGAGHGDKGQIRAMVKCLLPRATPDSADAADALAIAITHAHSRVWRRLEAAVAAAQGPAP